MNKLGGDGQEPADLDRIIGEITSGACAGDKHLREFRQALEDAVSLPCDALVIGEPVAILGFDYDGNERRGLTARCRRDDGSEHVVAAAEVVLPPRSGGVRWLAAYRRWLGLDPFPRDSAAPGHRRRRHKVSAADLDLSGPIELVVLSVKGSAARCTPLGSERVITLRASRVWDFVPGNIAVVKPRKQWSYAGHPYLSGEVVSSRLDVPALDLVPLRLEDRGIWNPDEHYWGEEDEPVEEWAKPIIARGPRRSFEMEQIVPGTDPDDFDSDPIRESVDLKEAGDRKAAYDILMDMCQSDLRCLDAHAHLGNFVFDLTPEDAIRHYEGGVRIGELSLARDFDGLLSWGDIDNRPFLRCMHGFGLCLWRLGRFEEAVRIFERMLWLNPSDNQGVRLVIDAVRAGTAWEPDREEG
jgi:tetratricopeptide (TPR) repeat protein